MKKIAVLSGAFGMLLFSGPVAVGLFCFMSYTLAGNTLTTAKAYAALAYFTMLRFPMSFLPVRCSLQLIFLIHVYFLDAYFVHI